jgi:hypothetical protein
LLIRVVFVLSVVSVFWLLPWLLPWLLLFLVLVILLDAQHLFTGAEHETATLMQPRGALVHHTTLAGAGHPARLFDEERDGIGFVEHA